MLSHVLMLRASSKEFGYEVDPRSVVDTSIDSRLPGGTALLEFTDAALFRRGLDSARRRLIGDVGENGLVGAAGVIGNFSMMNRIADATGMPVGKVMLTKTEELRDLLGINAFRHD